MDGIECFHTKHSTVMAERYLEIAEKYNLLVTGGSDCHGFSKKTPLIGTVKLPYEYVEKMKVKIAEKKYQPRMNTDKHGLNFSFGARASTRFNIQSEAALEIHGRLCSGHRNGVNAALHPCPSVPIRG
jgi:hypothetical protein